MAKAGGQALPMPNGAGMPGATTAPVSYANPNAPVPPGTAPATPFNQSDPFANDPWQLAFQDWSGSALNPFYGVPGAPNGSYSPTPSYPSAIMGLGGQLFSGGAGGPSPAAGPMPSPGAGAGVANDVISTPTPAPAPAAPYTPPTAAPAALPPLGSPPPAPAPQQSPLAAALAPYLPSIGGRTVSGSFAI